MTIMKLFVANAQMFISQLMEGRQIVVEQQRSIQLWNRQIHKLIPLDLSKIAIPSLEDKAEYKLIVKQLDDYNKRILNRFPTQKDYSRKKVYQGLYKLMAVAALLVRQEDRQRHLQTAYQWFVAKIDERIDEYNKIQLKLLNIPEVQKTTKKFQQQQLKRTIHPDCFMPTQRLKQYRRRVYNQAMRQAQPPLRKYEQQLSQLSTARLASVLSQSMVSDIQPSNQNKFLAGIKRALQKRTASHAERPLDLQIKKSKSDWGKFKSRMQTQTSRKVESKSLILKPISNQNSLKELRQLRKRRVIQSNRCILSRSQLAQPLSQPSLSVYGRVKEQVHTSRLAQVKESLKLLSHVQLPSKLQLSRLAKEKQKITTAIN